MSAEETLKNVIARQCGKTTAEAIVEQLKISCRGGDIGWLIQAGKIHQVCDVYDRDTFDDEVCWTIGTKYEGTGE